MYWYFLFCSLHPIANCCDFSTRFCGASHGPIRSIHLGCHWWCPTSCSTPWIDPTWLTQPWLFSCRMLQLFFFIVFDCFWGILQIFTVHVSARQVLGIYAMSVIRKSLGLTCASLKLSYNLSAEQASPSGASKVSKLLAGTFPYFSSLRFFPSTARYGLNDSDWSERPAI